MPLYTWERESPYTSSFQIWLTFPQYKIVLTVYVCLIDICFYIGLIGMGWSKNQNYFAC